MLVNPVGNPGWEPMMQDLDGEFLVRLIGKPLDKAIEMLDAESERIMDDRLNAMIPGGPHLGDPISKLFEEIHANPISGNPRELAERGGERGVK